MYANKLSLNTSKSNFAIFHPYQHKPDCKIQLKIYNNDHVPLEQKTFVKYLGIRMDGSMNGWIDGWMDGWMDGWTDGRMDGWMDGWMDVCMYVCMYGWMYVGFVGNA